jgi:hypothetical protein
MLHFQTKTENGSPGLLPFAHRTNGSLSFVCLFTKKRKLSIWKRTKQTKRTCPYMCVITLFWIQYGRRTKLWLRKMTQQNLCRSENLIPCILFWLCILYRKTIVTFTQIIVAIIHLRVLSEWVANVSTAQSCRTILYYKKIFEYVRSKRCARGCSPTQRGLPPIPPYPAVGGGITSTLQRSTRLSFYHYYLLGKVKKIRHGWVIIIRIKDIS